MLVRFRVTVVRLSGWLFEAQAALDLGKGDGVVLGEM